MGDAVRRQTPRAVKLTADQGVLRPGVALSRRWAGTLPVAGFVLGCLGKRSAALRHMQRTIMTGFGDAQMRWIRKTRTDNLRRAADAQAALRRSVRPAVEAALRAANPPRARHG